MPYLQCGGPGAQRRAAEMKKGQAVQSPTPPAARIVQQRRFAHPPAPPPMQAQVVAPTAAPLRRQAALLPSSPRPVPRVGPCPGRSAGTGRAVERREGVALCDFNGAKYDDPARPGEYLVFSKSERLVLLVGREAEGWAFGCVGTHDDERQGWFPPNFWLPTDKAAPTRREEDQERSSQRFVGSARTSQYRVSEGRLAEGRQAEERLAYARLTDETSLVRAAERLAAERLAEERLVEEHLSQECWTLESILQQERLEAQHVADERQAEERLIYSRFAEEASLERDDERLTAERLAEGRLTEQRILYRCQSLERSIEQARLDAQHVAEERQAEERLVYGRLAEEASLERTHERLAAERLAEERLAEQRTLQKCRALEYAEQERLDAQHAAEERHAEERLVDGRLAEGASFSRAAERLAAERLPQERLAEEFPAEDDVANERSSDQTSHVLQEGHRATGAALGADRPVDGPAARGRLEGKRQVVEDEPELTSVDASSDVCAHDSGGLTCGDWAASMCESWTDARYSVSDLRTYVRHFCGRLEVAEAERMVTLGGELLAAMLAGEEAALGSAATACPKQVASAIVWALMSRALRRGEGFQEGTFVVYGPGAERILLALLPYATGRPSSHFKGREVQLDSLHMHYGIDVPLDGSGDLPAEKRHVLMGLVRMPDESCGVYIKPENNGCETHSLSAALSAETIRHGLDYVNSQCQRRLGDRRAHDEGEFKRKEYVPREDEDRFNRHMQEMRHLAGEDLDRVQTYGISAMAGALRSQLARLSEAERNARTLLDWLEARYGSSLALRSGREVLIRTSELARPDRC